MKFKNIKIEDIRDIDSQFAFFHYTNKDNIESIDQNGLLPKIGSNAIGIEKTKKIFFVIGIKGVFSIIDVWIRWLIAKRLTDLPGKKADLPFYRLCAFFLRLPLVSSFVSFCASIVIWTEFRIKPFRIKSFKIMKEILDTSYFLKLDLEEGDFAYDDFDEAKLRFNKKILKQVYAKQRKISSKKVDYWNMHTLSDVIVAPNKISLLKIGDLYSCTDILVWMVKNTKIDIKVLTPYLYEFLNYYKLID